MAQVNFRVDDNVKMQAESALTKMGLSMSAAINIFLAKVANEKRIPFEVSIDPFYSEENIAELMRRIEDIEAGKNMREHELIEVD